MTGGAWHRSRRPRIEAALRELEANQTLADGMTREERRKERTALHKLQELVAGVASGVPPDPCASVVAAVVDAPRK
ncbi:MAG TPA: hypothetical protein VMA83_00745, partial [Solirubrobacteraceae bacterium]|nr:hypothetical protein [Solirubrobacteraceae bacterium]